jgi:AbrB family looped-hinge helix DNA binding protein
MDVWVNPRYYARMNVRLTMDKAGRVVIPKPLREESHLEPGDALEMESTGEQITLRPLRGTGPLTKEHGVWVFHTGQPLSVSSTDETLQQIREKRDLANLGHGERRVFSIRRYLCRYFTGTTSTIRPAWRSSSNSTNQRVAVERIKLSGRKGASGGDVGETYQGVDQNQLSWMVEFAALLHKYRSPNCRSVARPSNAMTCSHNLFGIPGPLFRSLQRDAANAPPITRQ